MLFTFSFLLSSYLLYILFLRKVSVMSHDSTKLNVDEDEKIGMSVVAPRLVVNNRQ